MTEHDARDDSHGPDAYFDVARLDDGRFRVQLVRRDAITRTSYAPRLLDVVEQMARARQPVRTQDDALRGMLRERQIALLDG